MRPEVLQYFASLYLRVHEIYGLSECTGPATANLPQSFRVGTSGRALPGCEIRFFGVDELGCGQVGARLALTPNFLEPNAADHTAFFLRIIEYHWTCVCRLVCEGVMCSWAT